MQESDEFNLSDNIQLVKLPSHWWAIHSFPKYVACARWNDACIVDRKVIVKDDNSIKMSLHDIDLQTEEKVSCIQDVSYLLQRLDDYTACSEATNSTDCCGYISMNKHGRNSTLCEVCRNKRKQKLRLVRRQHVSKLLYSRRNLYQRVLSTKRKCIRLKEKRFFSMMRNACGSNDHPDSTMFLQVYRLLSTYSLVKPPRGSNITGGEIVQFLFNSSDISYVKEDQEIFNEKLHTILQQGGNVSLFNTDHDYTNINSSDCIIYYLAGYFAWRAQRLTRCVECSKTLTSSEEKGAEISKLIDLKEKTLLSRPSNAMYTLVRLVEESTMNVTSKGPLHVDSFMDVLNDLEGRDKIPLLGCLNHQLELSEGILKMCLITRLHLICKRANYIDSFKAAKARKLRKFSKLS